MRVKGLIFRELYLTRKNYIICLCIWLMFSMLGILFQLSALYGNLAKLPVEDQLDMRYIWLYAPVIILASAAISNEMIYVDFASKWAVFSAVTPVSEKKYCAVKYIIKLVMLIFTAVMSFVNAAILCAVNGDRLDRQVVGIILLIILAFVVLSIFSQGAAYKYKDKNKSSLRLMIPMLIIYALFGLGMAMFMNYVRKANPGLSEEELSLLLNSYLDCIIDKARYIIAAAVPFLPFAIIAALAVGYFGCVRLMKRRDF